MGGGLNAQADLLQTESPELNGVWVASEDDDNNDDPSVDPVGIPIPFWRVEQFVTKIRTLLLKQKQVEILSYLIYNLRFRHVFAQRASVFIIVAI